MFGIVVLPAAWIRSLTEVYVVHLIGAFTTFFSIVLAMGDSALSQSWEAYAAPVVKLSNTFSVFGALSLAYGAAFIVPTLQRKHPDPQRMPRIIIVSMVAMTVIYTIIGVLGFSQYGCGAPGNVLLSMPESMWKRMACALMQIHIGIAAIVLMNPTVYYLERRMFNLVPGIAELERANPGIDYVVAQTPRGDQTPKDVNQLAAEVSLSAVEYSTRQSMQSILLRTSIIALQVCLAVILQSCFMEVVDFIGATTITLACVVLPCGFYLRMFHPSRRHRLLIWTIIAVNGILGVYTATRKLDVMLVKLGAKRTEWFAVPIEHPSAATYPYCPRGYDERFADLLH